MEFDSVEFLWAMGAASQGQDLCLCAPFNPDREVPSVPRAQQVTEPALHRWWEELCPAWSQSRRKAVSSQQCELKASEAGESHARFLRFYANCLRLGRSVEISVLADTFCVRLRSGVFMCVVCVCLSNENQPVQCFTKTETQTEILCCWTNPSLLF